MARLLSVPLCVVLAFGLLLAPSQAQPATAKTGCSPHAFQLEVFPPPDPDVIEWSPRAAFLGQQINYLVRVLPVAGCPGSGNRGYVKIGATATQAAVRVMTPRLRIGQVGEVFVLPRRFSNEDGFRFITVTIRGERHGYSRVVSQLQPVWMDRMDADSRALGRELLGPFLEYLEAEHPELGISPRTRFVQTPVRPRMLIVTWWLFFSAEWEIGLEYHSASWPPDDYARIYIRHRWDSWAPSRAWIMDSVGLGTPILEIVPPTTAVRGAEWWNICHLGEVCPE